MHTGNRISLLCFFKYAGMGIGWQGLGYGVGHVLAIVMEGYGVKSVHFFLFTDVYRSG